MKSLWKKGFLLLDLIIFMTTVITAQRSYYCGRRFPYYLPPPTGDEGSESRAYSWPWMAAIYIHVNGGPRNFLCAGSLISYRDILTAAHCFSGLSTNPSDYTVALRIYDVLSPKDGVVYNVENIIIHENFQKTEFYDDIAIVRLAEQVQFTDGIAPVCLPPVNYKSQVVESATSAVVTGWGDLTFADAENRTLHEMKIPIISNEECAETYSRIISVSFSEGINESVLCTGQSKDGKDPCQGDSGGPLVVSTPGGVRWIQVGVVSFGQGCSAPGYPGLYTSVSHFRDWIYKTTGI